MLQYLRFIVIFLAFFIPVATFAQHPSLFISKPEAAEIKAALGKFPLLDRCFKQAQQSIEAALNRHLEVPPPGEAGGYEHEKHKQNYREMQQAGLLFAITGEARYAQFVRDLLLAYAKMYPKLGAHPLAHNQAPGKIFHQMLNEVVWLVQASQAYDCVYDWLSPPDRTSIEKNLFRPMIEWFTVRNAKELNRIHNHGTWSVAAVGMLGYVLRDQNLVDMALYGTQKDGNGGFMKQLDLLFSPDGYYMEGPYYVRYALSPFFYFAEAIHRNQPELKIYAYRQQILRKAFYSAAQTVFPNGVFPPINDASKTMDIAAEGVVLANDLVYHRYGADPNLLAVAKIQNEVILNGAGLALAKDFAAAPKVPEMDWGSVEFTDGFDGQRGGLGILRMSKGKNQTMLLMKYGVHGEGHGHFDKLHFILFDQGREVIPDYGFGRWINVEPKFGGRYLPENKSYAMATIAHNTVVVDETTQNHGVMDDAEQVWGERHFFDGAGENVKVMSARANRHYDGVQMQRTMFLIKDNRLEHPVVVDLYRVTSNEPHQHDYPIHFNGQLIATNVKYAANTSQLRPLGTKHGYQHVWEEARGQTDEPLRFTWLDGQRYYSLVTSAAPQSQVIWGRSGANDPNFNLRAEPLVILRRAAKEHLFAAVIEPHGYFNEAQEKSSNARSSIHNVIVIGHDDSASVVEIEGQNELRWRVMVNNGVASATARHAVAFQGKKYEWVGNYKVELAAH